MSIELLITRYGLAAVFLGAGIEGETMVVTGGLLAHGGLMPVTGVAIAAAAGSFVADQLFFAAGRRFRDHPRVRKIEAKPAFATALGLFERHPTAFVFGFRFLYGLRTVSPMAIGTTSIRTSTFAALNAAAAVVWAIVFTAIGFVFADGIEQVFGKMKSIEHIAIGVGIAAALLVGMVQLVRWWRRA
ncbi:MAG: DedA family protein [Pseudomonadota bacterium]|jgi:membrane protein DedA with SNARE-associated domain|uniref:DedA family protein n=1 Tax=Sphingomonas sp. TaxID=28214 RepID=UPI0025EA7C0A|nr:DedA family protein [Sphingomonas sp.]MDQ2764334.1 DedA family protein [Pseudomonadota bacterium]